ncbi:MAG: SDR family oxidoreductase [Chloroflexi bacterium]|nr:SDR family oxidoreductase [Chloroflexota bacterium]
MPGRRPNVELEGKAAIVTGGGTGIGEAIALILAREGAAVAVAGRRREPVETTVAKINQAGGKALAISADVALERDVERLVAETLRAFGQVDLLVNNAGVDNKLLRLSETPVSLWDEVIATNLRGAFLCIRAVLPTMMERRSGVIVNVLSNLVHSGQAVPGFSAYIASKMGLLGLTRVLANEVHEYGIRVHGVAPGKVDTPLGRTRPYATPQELATRLKPEDVAELVRWLVTQPPRVNIEDVTVMPYFAEPWRN